MNINKKKIMPSIGKLTVDFRVIDKISRHLNLDWEKARAIAGIHQYGYSWAIQEYPKKGVDYCIEFAKQKIASFIELVKPVRHCRPYLVLWTKGTENVPAQCIWTSEDAEKEGY